MKKSIKILMIQRGTYLTPFLRAYSDEFNNLGHQCLHVVEGTVPYNSALAYFEPDIVYLHLTPQGQWDYLSEKRIIFTHHDPLLHYYLNGTDDPEYIKYVQTDTLSYPYVVKERALFFEFFRFLGQYSQLHLVAMSALQENSYLQLGFQSKSISLIPNGIAISDIPFRNVPSNPRGLVVANFEKRKRSELLFPDYFPIDFIGSGYNQPDLQQRVKGYFPREEVLKQITNYQTLVQLSMAEGHSLACIEALAAGLSLVVSEGAAANLDLSLPFINLVHNKLLESEDFLNSTIQESINSNPKHRSMCRAYAQQFCIRKIVGKHVELIKQLL